MTGKGIAAFETMKHISGKIVESRQLEQKQQKQKKQEKATTRPSRSSTVDDEAESIKTNLDFLDLVMDDGFIQLSTNALHDITGT